MEREEQRPLRDDLAALRIERGGGDAPGRPPWIRWSVLGLLVIVFLAGSWLAYELTLGAGRTVDVAYARVAHSGSPSGAVLTGSGYVVTGDRYISLGVRVPGRIEAYLVEEGDRVKAGDPLVRLDGRAYAAGIRQVDAEIREARANLELRRKELARLLELRKADVASEAELDVKRNEVVVTEASIARLDARKSQLQIDLDDTVLRAPTNAVVLEKFKEVGEMATPGGFAGSGELIRLANLDELRAEVDVNEADLSRIYLHQPAEVVPDAYPDRRYDATVVKLYPRINRQKGTLKVEVRIREPDAQLRPDMSVRIRFLAEAHDPSDDAAPSVLVRGDAVRTDASGSFVWQVTDGRVRRRPVVAAGDVGGNEVVIRSGLAGGEAVVVGDAGRLVEGDAVETAD